MWSIVKKIIKFPLLVIMLLSLFNVNQVFSGEYYVDVSNPQASDSNSGSEISPWSTIQHAANLLNAGDICFVKEGVYPERVTPAHSGQAGNLITYKSIGNARILGFQLANRQYIRIIGFEFTHNYTSARYEAISMSNSHGCQILDNYLHHTYTLGIWMRQTAPTNNVLIAGNRISYIGSVAGHEMGEIAIKLWGDNNIVEYNDISHVGDFLNVWGEKNIIRNNYFHDCYYSDFPDFQVSNPQGHHIDGLQYWSDSRMLITTTLVENNYFRDIVVQHAHIVLLQDESNTGSSHFIFRNNAMVRNGSYPFMVDHMDYVKVFHNTFVDVLYSQIPKALYCIVFKDGANYGGLINNVFYNSVRDGGYVYYLDSESENGFYGDYNLAYNSTNVNATWGSPIRNEIHTILNRDPRFISYTNDDFQLQNYSPCIGGAGPLTTTRNSGNGSTIYVHDATYFSDGWGLTKGDIISVGTSEGLKIISIDYDNNTISVDKNISWNLGDRVNLAYRGTAPDIGAFEYIDDANHQIGVNILSPTDGSSIRGVVEVELDIINEEYIRQIAVLVDEIPERIFQEHPFNSRFNIDGLTIGDHTIEVRAYAHLPGSQLTQSDIINLTIVVHDEIPPAPPSNVRIITVP